MYIPKQKYSLSLKLENFARTKWLPPNDLQGLQWPWYSNAKSNNKKYGSKSFLRKYNGTRVWTINEKSITKIIELIQHHHRRVIEYNVMRKFYFNHWISIYWWPISFQLIWKITYGFLLHRPSITYSVHVCITIVSLLFVVFFRVWNLQSKIWVQDTNLISMSHSTYA